LQSLINESKYFFEVTLFDSDHTLIAMLEKVEIEFRKVPVERKLVVALDETIKVANIGNHELLHIFSV
jgi:hypothetical protein